MRDKNTIILSEVIKENLEVLGFKNYRHEKAIEYLLKKNIETILGKNAFSKEEFDINIIRESFVKDSVEGRKKGRRNILQIVYAGNKYTIIKTWNKEILEMKDSSKQSNFRIFINEEEIFNTLSYKEDNLSVCEYQTIGIGKKEHFDYQKVIYTPEGEIVLPAYRMKPINVKINDTEIFNLEVLDEQSEMSYFKRLHTIYENLKDSGLSFANRIYSYLKEAKVEASKSQNLVEITTSRDLVNIYSYLPDIYAILEAKCQGEDYTLKKVK